MLFWGSWICGSMSFTKGGSFQPSFLRIFFCPELSLSFWDSSNINVKPFAINPQMFEALLSFQFLSIVSLNTFYRTIFNVTGHLLCPLHSAAEPIWAVSRFWWWHFSVLGFPFGPSCLFFLCWDFICPFALRTSAFTYWCIFIIAALKSASDHLNTCFMLALASVHYLFPRGLIFLVLYMSDNCGWWSGHFWILCFGVLGLV